MPPAVRKEREELLKVLAQLEALLEAGISKGDFSDVERITRLIEKARVALSKTANQDADEAVSLSNARRDDVRIGGHIASGAAVGDGQVIAGQIVGGHKIEHPGIYIQHLENLIPRGIELDFAEQSSQIPASSAPICSNAGCRAARSSGPT
jgi:hypothetical protein